MTAATVTDFVKGVCIEILGLGGLFGEGGAGLFSQPESNTAAA